MFLLALLWHKHYVFFFLSSLIALKLQKHQNFNNTLLTTYNDLEVSAQRSEGRGGRGSNDRPPSVPSAHLVEGRLLSSSVIVNGAVPTCQRGRTGEVGPESLRRAVVWASRGLGTAPGQTMVDTEECGDTTELWTKTVNGEMWWPLDWPVLKVVIYRWPLGSVREKLDSATTEDAARRGSYAVLVRN